MNTSAPAPRTQHSLNSTQLMCNFQVKNATRSVLSMNAASDTESAWLRAVMVSKKKRIVSIQESVTRRFTATKSKKSAKKLKASI